MFLSCLLDGVKYEGRDNGRKNVSELCIFSDMFANFIPVDLLID